MEAASNRLDCAGCPSKVICHCLKITEDTLVQALETLNLRSLKDIRQHTGAGEGCTACHRRLWKYLQHQQAVEVVAIQPSSPSPICD
jgi:NAD(P)H-nitrite reductase large subunit